jgi:bifunctional NMN adenylyltransferase/nudix hydrolase
MDYLENVGKKVKKCKPSGQPRLTNIKPFKSGSIINTVKGVINHPYLNVPAYTFIEDDSYVECARCGLVEENMKQYKKAIVFGRFQPYHFGHDAMIKRAFELADKVLIYIGSSNKPRTNENPFTYEERLHLVWANVEGATQTNCTIRPLNDYIHDNARWKKQVTDYLKDETSVVIVGGAKDTWYKEFFPEYDVDLIDNLVNGEEPLSSTYLRKGYFEGSYDDMKLLEKFVPGPTYSFLKEFRKSKWYGYIFDWYAKKKKLNTEFGTGPFLTVDNVITHKGNLLLIKRKNHPGKGLYAIPGGFLDKHETFEEGSYRELQEETNLSITMEEFQQYFVERKIYDHVKRSAVSRIITMASYIHLPTGLEVEVEAGDDASHAFWYPINKLGDIKNLFYDDHFSIVEYFLGDFP